MQKIIGVLLFQLALTANAEPSKDACLVQIPETLNASLKDKFPDYRAPQANDNIAEDIEWDIKEGGKGCLGLALADFDGDGTKDYLIGLTSKNSPGALIVVGLARGSTWEFHTFAKWKEQRSRLFVAAQKSGHFRRSQAFEGPTSQGELKSMNCRTYGAQFGATESWSVVYCYAQKKWNYVRVSD
jgi:hypothetical protein